MNPSDAKFCGRCGTPASTTGHTHQNLDDCVEALQERLSKLEKLLLRHLRTEGIHNA